VASYYVYILECSDKSLYTGITTDIERRLDEHNSGQGARYTSSRAPVILKYVEEVSDRSEASKREYSIKKMTRAEKYELIEEPGETRP